MNDVAAPVSSTPACTSPVDTALTPGTPPRYGTLARLAPRVRRRSLMTKWPIEPLPVVATERPLGVAFDTATRSVTHLTARPLVTTSTTGAWATTRIGSKSFHL